MNFEDRLTQTQAKLDELKAKINDSIDSAKAAHEADKKEAMINLAKINAAIEDWSRDVEAQVYCDVTSMKEEAKADADAMNDALDEIDAKINEGAARCDAAAEKVMNKIDDDLDTVEGDFYAAGEDARLARERFESKLNSTRLKVQMHLEEGKAKIEAKKTAIDKAAQEELIMDLLDYADDCQLIAYAYAMEAELAILDACDQIEDYESKYGKIEEA